MQTLVAIVYLVTWTGLALVCAVKLRSRAGRKLAVGFGLLAATLVIGRFVLGSELAFDLLPYWARDVLFDLLPVVDLAGCTLLGLGLLGFARDSSPEEDIMETPDVVRGDVDIRPCITPGERRMVVILSALSTLLGLAILVVLWEEPSLIGALALFAGLVLISAYVGARVIRGRVLGNSIKVGPDQFPEIDRIKRELMIRLDYDRPTEVYVADGPLNAFLARFLATRYVILNSSLVASMDPVAHRAEMEWVLARAIGHLKAKHFRFWLVQYLISIEKLNPLLYLLYERMCHYSSDRIGLVACRDEDAAVRALIKLLVGDKLSSAVDEGRLRQQAAETGLSVGAFLAELGSPHPHLVKRVLSLRDFAATQRASETPERTHELAPSPRPTREQREPLAEAPAE